MGSEQDLERRARIALPREGAAGELRVSQGGPAVNSNVIITCAVTGGGDTVGKSPHVPVTPAQIAQSCLEAADAGATAVHIHVRDPETGAPSRDVALYAETVERIRAKNSRLILNLTGGMGADILLGDSEPFEFRRGTDCVGPLARIQHILDLGADIGSLDIGSMNFDDVIYATTPNYGREIATRMRAAGVKPEVEVFDLGHIELAKQLVSEGLFEAPPIFQLCLGVKYGAPATPDGMKAMRDLLPAGAIWAGFGISRQQIPMVAQAVLMGGHVRVGLEDNLYLGRGELATNAQLVARAVQIIELLGGKVMGPDEARRTLGLRPSNDASLRPAA
jgi:uncharacterized protein (DUF849 family)